VRRLGHAEPFVVETLRSREGAILRAATLAIELDPEVYDVATTGPARDTGGPVDVERADREAVYRATLLDDALGGAVDALGDVLLVSKVADALTTPEASRLAFLVRRAREQSREEGARQR